jgi:hypothetical protein
MDENRFKKKGQKQKKKEVVTLGIEPRTNGLIRQTLYALPTEQYSLSLMIQSVEDVVLHLVTDIRLKTSQRKNWKVLYFFFVCPYKNEFFIKNRTKFSPTYQVTKKKISPVLSFQSSSAAVTGSIPYFTRYFSIASRTYLLGIGCKPTGMSS